MCAKIILVVKPKNYIVSTLLIHSPLGFVVRIVFSDILKRLVLRACGTKHLSRLEQ